MKVLDLPFQAPLQKILLVHHLKKHHHPLLQVVVLPHRLPAALLHQTAQVVVLVRHPLNRVLVVLLNQAAQAAAHLLRLRIPTLLTLSWIIK